MTCPLDAVPGDLVDSYDWTVDDVVDETSNEGVMPIRPRVFGWASPWSGDDHEPVPTVYRLVWFPLYRWTRKAKHWVGWHDWSFPGYRGGRCTWCGRWRLPYSI